MEIAYIVETRVKPSRQAADAHWRPWMVQAGTPFTLQLDITSDDGRLPAAATPILVALHLCAWRRDETDSAAPGMAGFASETVPFGVGFTESIPHLLPAGELTTSLAIDLVPPRLSGHARAVLHVHIYLAEGGALIGHAARAVCIVDPTLNERELVEVMTGWSDEQTGDDLRKGIGYVVLPLEPLPHPSLVLYAAAHGADLALAASVYSPANGGTIRLHDLGRMRDPDEVCRADGIEHAFSLPAYLADAGGQALPAPSTWSPALALTAANALRAMLPETCRRFLTELVARSRPDAQQPAPTVLISTDDLLFPWELVRVTADGDPEARTFGQVAAVSRWPHHKPLPGHVRVRRTAFIAPASATISLSAQVDRDLLASEEADSVQAFVGGQATFRRIEPSTIPSVVGALGSSEYQLLHLRSHGTRYGVQLAAASGAYEPAVFSLRPKHLPGRDAGRALNPPFVFINVCGGAFLESELWLDALLGYGVGLAVVTLWNVASNFSKNVAERLYDGLAEGASVAEAIRSVRAIHAFDARPGPRGPEGVPPFPPAMRRNPTVLSYIALGHPAARVIPV
jgi:hypothetical protein